MLETGGRGVGTPSPPPPDLSARYGGEEFICVLPDTNLEGGRKGGRTILKAIRSLCIPPIQSQAAEHVTISIGVTSIVPGHGNVPDDFIHRVVGLLYESKKMGCDRMTVRALAHNDARGINTLVRIDKNTTTKGKTGGKYG